jgi:serine/threonine protein kinase
VVLRLAPRRSRLRLLLYCLIEGVDAGASRLHFSPLDRHHRCLPCSLKIISRSRGNGRQTVISCLGPMNAQTPEMTPQEARRHSPGDSIVHEGRIYTLGNELGQGYFGKVYSCTDRWANELVAKVLLPNGRAYDQVRNEWARELSNLQTLRHPNVTFVFDAFEQSSTFYLILERCGSDFRDLITMPNLSGEQWLPAVARDILQGLEFIHTAGYVHKDIHPGNVFVSWHRDRMLPRKEAVASFKIGDLGITRLESDINVFHTMLAQWMLPPEALDADKFGLVGRKVDIYHAGLLFLALLLGRIPEFSREQVLAAEPRRLAESLDSRYAGAIAKALRRHTDQRHQSAGAFWDELVSVMPPNSIPI